MFANVWWEKILKKINVILFQDLRLQRKTKQVLIYFRRYNKKDLQAWKRGLVFSSRNTCVTHSLSPSFPCAPPECACILTIATHSDTHTQIHTLSLSLSFSLVDTHTGGGDCSLCSTSSVGFEPVIVGTRFSLNETFSFRDHYDCFAFREKTSRLRRFLSCSDDLPLALTLAFSRVNKTFLVYFKTIFFVILWLKGYLIILWCDWPKTLWRGSLTNLFHFKRCQLRWKLLQSWLISNRKLKLRIIVILPLLLRQILWTLPCRRNNPNPNNSSISTRNLINNYTNKITAGYDIYFNVAKWGIESNS